MDHTRLIATAKAMWGFCPEWPPPLMDKILQRVDELGTNPAVYLRAVFENKHDKTHTHMLRNENVILSKKWGDFINDTLKLMIDEGRVRYDCDLMEFRVAMRLRAGDHRKVLDDPNIPLSPLFRNQVADMYGFSDLVEKYSLEATGQALANPSMLTPYEELRKMLQ